MAKHTSRKATQVTENKATSSKLEVETATTTNQPNEVLEVKENKEVNSIETATTTNQPNEVLEVKENKEVNTLVPAAPITPAIAAKTAKQIQAEKRMAFIELMRQMAAQTGMAPEAIEAAIDGADLLPKPRRSEVVTYACIDDLATAWLATDRKSKFTAILKTDGEGDIAQRVIFDPIVDKPAATPTTASNGDGATQRAGNGVLIDGGNFVQACRWIGLHGGKYKDAQVILTQLGFRFSDASIAAQIRYGKTLGTKWNPSADSLAIIKAVNPTLVPAAPIAPTPTA